MNIAKIKPCDIADGPGVRVSVFVSGCRRHCPGCHNAEAWDFGFGEPYTEQTKEYILKLLEPDYIDGITILGGEPFEPENVAGVAELIYTVYEKFGYKKTVWVYTGYTLEELLDMRDGDCEFYWEIESILNNTQILVDGEYREQERDLSIQFRGSRNQRIIDLERSFDLNKIVLWEGLK